MPTVSSAPLQPTKTPGTHLPTYIFDTPDDVARHVARIVAGVIRERNARGQHAVLGLPTGSTPVGVYRELARMYREEGLDFSRVITFNLDEYFGLASDALQSYHRWMQEHFFRHVNVPQGNIHIPDGTVTDQPTAFAHSGPPSFQDGMCTAQGGMPSKGQLTARRKDTQAIVGRWVDRW